MFSFLDDNIKVYLDKCGEIIKSKYSESFESATRNPSSSWNDSELISSMYMSSWDTLNLYMRNPVRLDMSTKYNRKYIESYLIDKNILISEPKLYLSIILRVVWEYNIFSSDDPFKPSRICLDRAFVERLDDVQTSSWGRQGSIDVTFSWITNSMCFEIYNDFLNSPELRDARNLTSDISKAQSELETKVNAIINSATSSVEYLDTVRNEAKELSDRLTDVKREGNFKLLAKAFSTIRANKKDEVYYAQFRVWIFVALLVLMPSCLFGYFIYKDVTFTWLSALRYTPIISLEVLFFLFYAALLFRG